MSHDARVKALDGLLEEAGLDAVLATKDASIAYLTGFWGLQLERFFGVAVTARRRGRADRPVAGPRERRHRADRPREDALQRRRSPTGCRSCSTTLDGAKRIGVEEDHLNFARAARAGRGRLRARARHRRDHAPARRQGRGGGRGRPARLRAHRGRLRRAVGRPEGRATPRPRSTPRRRTASRAAARRTPSRTSCSARTPRDPHGSPGARELRRRRRRRRRHLRAVRRLLGRPHALRARRPAERLGRAGVGGRARGLRRRGRRDARRQAPRRDVDAAQRAIVEAQPGPRRLPARRGPRDRDRDPRAAVPRPQLGRRRCARA